MWIRARTRTYCETKDQHRHPKQIEVFSVEKKYEKKTNRQFTKHLKQIYRLEIGSFSSFISHLHLFRGWAHNSLIQTKKRTRCLVIIYLWDIFSFSLPSHHALIVKCLAGPIFFSPFPPVVLIILIFHFHQKTNNNDINDATAKKKENNEKQKQKYKPHREMKKCSARSLFLCVPYGFYVPLLCLVYVSVFFPFSLFAVIFSNGSFQNFNSFTYLDDFRASWMGEWIAKIVSFLAYLAL